MSDVPETPRSAPVEEPERSKREDGVTPSLRPTVDDMSEWSFPASDPPATWNWEPRAP